MASVPSCSCAFFLCALTLSAAAHAFEIEHSEARYKNKRYGYDLVVTIDAPVGRVEAVLRDYEHYPQLDTDILRARILERPADDVVMLETMLHACFGLFCRDVKRIERVQESPQALAAITDPARSDVRFGETHTQLSATSNGGTRVSYRTSMTPGFWIPPIIGRRWMLNRLEDATLDLFRNVEVRAQAASE